MHITDERIQSLREKMKEYRMDAYLVPTADFHESEYVGEYFKCRKYLTGFNRISRYSGNYHERGMSAGGRKILVQLPQN